MLLCGSANRAKSWACEHCDNWIEIKDPDICRTCYWAYPNEYSHIAMEQVRRIDLLWSGDDVNQFDKIKKLASTYRESVSEYVKGIIRKHLIEKFQK